MKYQTALFCLLSFAVALASCTAVPPPSPVLPQRSGVVPGETITIKGMPNAYKIAQDYNVSMRDIIVLNGLQPPYLLKDGQSLVLPFKRPDGSSGSVMGAAPLPTSDMGMTSYANAPFLTGSGGSVQSESLPAIQSTSLPPVSSAPAPMAPPANMLGKTQPSARLDAPVNPPRQVATTMSLPPVASVPSSDTSTVASSSAPDMVWPVQGPVVSSFGPKGQGVNNDGVNITAPKGAPVVAAANGIVVYAGDDMKGFGNLVLIRHEGGWVTAYAHLDRVLVSKDAAVAQGDMIGTVGKSGNISSPQLHFETRHDGKAVDPNGIVKGH